MSVFRCSQYWFCDTDWSSAFNQFKVFQYSRYCFSIYLGQRIFYIFLTDMATCPQTYQCCKSIDCQNSGFQTKHLYKHLYKHQGSNLNLQHLCELGKMHSKFFFSLFAIRILFMCRKIEINSVEKAGGKCIALSRLVMKIDFSRKKFETTPKVVRL